MIKFFYLFFTILSTSLFCQEQNKEEINHHNTNIKVITSTTWAPINMYDENEQLNGIAVDFWNLIKTKANLKDEIIIAKDWNDVLDSIKNKTADITIGTTFDKNKLNYANFSKAYISFPIAFATLEDKGFIPDGSFLEGKKVAVGENYSSHLIMKEAYPKIEFVPVKNTKEALKLLSANKVDAVIDILPVIAHLMSVNGYYNLKISGTSEEKVLISFMIRNDYPLLLNVINNQIEQITNEEKNNIVRKWLTVKYDKRFIDYEILLQFFILFIIIVVFYGIKQKDLKKYNKKLEELSNTDSLTKLYNRRKIDEILHNLKNKKFSLILLDIDNFKNINDTYGHLKGDEILIKLANLLKLNLNSNDEIGRWGGEEFLIICKNTSEEQALIIAQRLREIIENYNFGLSKINASFGICEATKDLQIKDILTNTDKALYKAKENGRNQAVKYSNLIS